MVLKRSILFLVLMFVCSAYAEDTVLVGIGHDNTSGNGYIGMTTSTSGVVTSSANCSDDPLLYHGTAYDNGTYTFEAQWNPGRYKIIYHPGYTGFVPTGVTGTMSDQSVSFGVNATLTQNAYVAPGYTFTGWLGDYSNGTPDFSGGYPTSNNVIGSSTPITVSGQQLGGGTNYADLVSFSPYNIPNNLNLYAIWKANSYNITYDCDCAEYGADCSGSNPPVDNNTYTVENTNVSLAQNGSNNCSVIGHNFNGWECKQVDSNNNAGADVTLTGSVGNQSISGNFPANNVKCYAKWGGANTYNINYSCGTIGGSAPSSTPVQYQGSWALVSDAGSNCNDTGVHFVGWKCDHTIASGAVYNGTATNYPLDNGAITGGSGNSYGLAGDTNCTAVWDANEINLVWNTNGGTSVTTPTTCIYGTNNTIIPQQPTRTGYTFGGWKIVDWSAQ